LKKKKKDNKADKPLGKALIPKGVSQDNGHSNEALSPHFEHLLQECSVEWLKNKLRSGIITE